MLKIFLFSFSLNIYRKLVEISIFLHKIDWTSYEKQKLSAFHAFNIKKRKKKSDTNEEHIIVLINERVQLGFLNKNVDSATAVGGA